MTRLLRLVLASALHRSVRQQERRANDAPYRLMILLTLLALAVLSWQARAGVERALAASPASGPHQFASGGEINAYLTKKGFSGYALFTRRGKVLLSKGYGMANHERKIADSIDTRWPMFGLHGYMDAVAVLRLQEQGKLSVRDKLCRYLASCPKTWGAITLHDLLLGSSGINAVGGDMFTTPGGTIAQSVQACRRPPLSQGTDLRHKDNGCNRLMLSVVIAKVAREPFNMAMQQLVFGPAGMRATSVVRAIPSEGVKGYLGGMPAPRLYAGRFPLVYSTVRDLFRLDRALLGGKLISKHSQAALLRPYVNTDPGGTPLYAAYGPTWVMKAHQYSWNDEGPLSPLNTERVVFGGTNQEGTGFITDNWFSPDDGSIAIWLNNDAGAFTNDDDNAFVGHLPKLMWLK